MKCNLLFKLICVSEYYTLKDSVNNGCKHELELDVFGHFYRTWSRQTKLSEPEFEFEKGLLRFEVGLKSIKLLKLSINSEKITEFEID